MTLRSEGLGVGDLSPSADPEQSPGWVPTFFVKCVNWKDTVYLSQMDER